MGRKGLNERLKRPLLSPNYGGLTHPAVSLVLKTSGARDGMGIDTSALRQCPSVRKFVVLLDNNQTI